MVLRTLLHFSESTGRCFLTTVKSKPAYLQNSYSIKHIRGFRRIRDTIKQTDDHLADSLTPTVPALTKLWKPFAFTIVFGSTVHAGAAIWQYEQVRSSVFGSFQSFQRRYVTRKGWRGEMQKVWKQLSDGEKIFIPICFLNVLVYAAWRMPMLKSTMIRYFCANPGSKSTCWPMVFSTFSHSSLLHLAVNMYVLHSFSTAAVSTLGKEQFIALYLTSGVTSSFASHLYKTIFSRPGLSLGASGAIMGVVGLVCMQFPETHISIAFLPMITFTAGNAIKGLLVMDTVGCIAGWRFLDHAAHLGGVLWGIFWQTWGNAHLWQRREKLLTYWHKLRESLGEK